MKKYFALTCLTMLFYSMAMAQTNVTVDVTSVYSYSNPFTVGQTCNITFTNRIFYPGVWEFICLPFDASEATLDATFGADNYELQQFSELVDDNNFHFLKMETPQLTAGVAYLIRTKSRVTNPTFNNVTVTLNSDPTSFHGTENMALKGVIFSHNWDLANDGYYQMTEGMLKNIGWRYGGSVKATAAYVVSSNTTVVPKVTPEKTTFEGLVFQDDDPMFVKMANRIQLTNVPAMYIDIPDVTDLDTELTKDRDTGIALYHQATIKVVATDDTSSPYYLESFEETNPQDMEIKVRGNATAVPSKRAYRLKFASKKTSSTGKAKKHDLTGKGYAERNWVLLANTFDHSMLQNALSCEMSELVGLSFTPGNMYVDLVINGDYRGTYQVTDHCDVGSHRIDVDEDTGWYVEFQGNTGMLDQPMCFVDDLLMNIKNPEPADENDEAQCNAIINPIKEWFTTVWIPSFNANFTDPITGWRAYNDEETWVKFLVLTELTGDWDGLMTVKAYREADGKLFLGPIWDKDLAYSNFQSDTSDILVSENPNGSTLQGIVRKLYTDPMFIKKMKELLDRLIDEGLENKVHAFIDNTTAMIAQTWALNYTRWDVTHQEGMEAYYQWQNQEDYANNLKSWMSARIATLQQLINEKYEAACTPTDFTYDVTVSSTDAMSAKGDKLVNVTMTNRSFTKDAWNALTLPFAPSLEQMKTAFGDNYELREFTGVSEDGNKMLFLPVEDRLVAAGKPYLIKPSADVPATLTFDEVVLRNPVINYSLVNGVTVTYGDYSFSGMTLAENKAVDGSVLLIDTDGTTLKKPEKVNSYDTSAKVNGSMAFITKAEGAPNPIISFVAEEPVPEGVTLLDLLSEKTPYTIDEDMMVTSVTYKREFSSKTAGHRQCWFVPFDYIITDEDLDRCTFYRIHMFSAAADQEGVVQDENKVVMKIVEVSAGYTLKANKPYIIKPKTAGVYEFVAENATLKAMDMGSLKQVSTTINDYDFYGVYDFYSTSEAQQWFSLNTNGNLKWNEPNQRLGAYRWYIKSTFIGDDYANIAFVIDEENEGDETTAISNIAASDTMDGDGSFYTIDGRRLMGIPTQKGIYIQKGKKVVVK